MLQTNDPVQQCQPWELPDNLDFWVGRAGAPWVVNIDLDYFFCRDEGRAPCLMFSKEYLGRFCEKLRPLIADGTVAVTTICLTPDWSFTGGWAPAERLMELVLSCLGIDFRLPSAGKRDTNAT